MSEFIAVSMHLLVLSAFRPENVRDETAPAKSLNAPFGAQCFPTWNRHIVDRDRQLVSMHLLVLSAFRLMRS